MIDTSTIPATGAGIRSLVRTATIDARPAQTWADWASADRLVAWWPVPETNIDLRVGGPLELLFSTDAPEGQRGSEGCQYLSYVPGEMISFTWNAPPHLALRTSNTWVVITFSATDDGRTDVRLVHTGFLEGPDWDAYRAYFGEAWTSVLELHRRHYLRDGSGAN